MYSDQESNPDRENHPPNSGKVGSSAAAAAAAAAARTAPGSSQPSGGKPMRFKVVRYEEYRQKWGTKGRASVWDEHLPGVPTSLPPKTEMELRTEQNLLMCDPMPATPIAYPHIQCHQQPQLSRRSHYERIPLAMLHYPKCDQARKPGAAGRLEVASVAAAAAAMRADDEPSPARSRRRHKASLPCPAPAGQLDGASSTGTPPTELSAPQDANAAGATATTATSDSSKVPSSSMATPPLLQSQQSSQPPSRQAPPLLQSTSTTTPPQPSSHHRTPPPANLDLEATEDRSDEPPNPPNPPASPVPEQRPSPPNSATAANAANSSQLRRLRHLSRRCRRLLLLRVQLRRELATPTRPAVKRGRFTVAVAAAPPGSTPAVPPQPPSSVSSAEDAAVAATSVAAVSSAGSVEQSAAAVSAAGEVSQNAHEVAVMCQSYKPAMAHLFTPERVQAAFNWISHYREDSDEDSTFQVTIDNVAQTVMYLSSQDGKKKKEQIAPPIVTPVTGASTAATSSSSPALVGIATGGGGSSGGGGGAGGGGSSSGSGNMTRSSSVETRLEARINGVTDMLQGAILSTVKSEMEPLQQLVQHLRTAVQQRDAEIQTLNQTLRPLLSEETMTAILNRQSRLSRPE
uniref:Bromo domain-containing protein n=1 Tax=Macrostomum lignano TaxID=282301 RepID=A0A1I8GYD9_9PLAT